MFFCGSFNKDDDIDVLSCPLSPKNSSSKRSNSYKKKENKNRYANRGLDKFYELLSQLDEKKQKIYTQKGAEDITLVRFVISSDHEIKPIIVVKEKRQSHAKDKISILSQNLQKSTKIEDKKAHDDENDKKMMKKYMHFDFKLERFKQPVYYLPVFLMFVLLFLAMYGKSFAILCTSILWYLIPAIQGQSSSEKESGKAKRPVKKEFTRRYYSEKIFVSDNKQENKKKEFTRRFSEKIFVSGNQQDNNGSMSSPTSVINGPTKMLPGEKHGHRRSF